jgi:hypothetical protein
MFFCESKSMDNIIKNYGIEQGIKLSANNVSVSGKVDAYPLYMAIFL